MQRSYRLVLLVGMALIAVGALIGLLPKDWIEEVFRLEPDAGNGALELVLTVAPLIAGVALCAWALIGRQRASRGSSRFRV